MAKPSHGTTRYAGKKKAKKRSEPTSVAPIPMPDVDRKAVQPEEKVQEQATGTVLRFRPRAQETVTPRRGSARSGSMAKAVLQTVDYSYVYTDLKIIAGLVTALVVILVILSFVIR